MVRKARTGSRVKAKSKVRAGRKPKRTQKRKVKGESTSSDGMWREPTKSGMFDW